jgi:histidyl-tRNA synthetase
MSEDNFIEPRLLKGFRDTLPSRMITRMRMIATVEAVLQKYGFLPLETPVLEYADILLGKLGDEGEKLLYRFKDHGDREVAMRYDLTVPLARVIAQYPELPKPFKRYQVSPVWRADNTQRGRYREFYQFDLDIVGSDTILSDAEILVLKQDILLSLGITDFIIRVNDRSFLNDLSRQIQLDDAQQKVFYAGLDKWDKIGQDAVVDCWQNGDLSKSHIDALLVALERAKTVTNPLADTFAQAKLLGLQDQYVVFDPTIVRGLDYYSGIVFETNLTHAPEFGSVFSGGRYDGLVGRFSKQSYPAVGTSIGVDRLLSALEQLQLIPEVQTTTTVFMTLFSEELTLPVLQMAKNLRDQSINVEVSYDAGQLGKQVKTAAAKGIPYVVILGPDEMAAGQVTIRELATGQEQRLDQSGLSGFFLDRQ